MDSPTDLDRRPPVLAAMAATRNGVDELAEASMWSLSETETADLIGQLVRLQASLAAVEAKALRHAETLECAADAGRRPRPTGSPTPRT